MARDGEEVLAAQRLRYRVFAEGWARRRARPPRGRRRDALYSETEFDLRALDAVPGPCGALVANRPVRCAPDHRTGAVVGLVWTGTARYLPPSGHRLLAGRASVPLTEGGTPAAGVWRTVRNKHRPDWSARPAGPAVLAGRRRVDGSPSAA